MKKAVIRNEEAILQLNKKSLGDGNQYKLEVTKCRKLMREAKDIREKSMVSRAGDSKDYLSMLEKKKISQQQYKLLLDGDGRIVNDAEKRVHQ